MDYYLDRPLNFAHRGASKEAPENTLAAFLRAAELGADGIEFDVQLSKEHEVVVIHDFSLETATNGQGRVRDKTLPELRELDAGSWFDPAFAGQAIPTLQETIDAVGRSLLLNIELKTTSLRDDGLASAVVQAIEDNGLLDRVLVSSFNPLSLRWVKRLNAQIPVGLLYAPDSPFLLRKPWLRSFARADALHPHHSLVSTEYVRWAKSQGYRVNTWTTDDPSRMEQMVHSGVDLIITNRPDMLKQVLSVAAGKGK